MQGFADLMNRHIGGVEHGLGFDENPVANYPAGAFAGHGFNLTLEVCCTNTAAIGVELNAPLLCAEFLKVIQKTEIHLVGPTPDSAAKYILFLYMTVE